MVQQQFRQFRIPIKFISEMKTWVQTSSNAAFDQPGECLGVARTGSTVILEPLPLRVRRIKRITGFLPRFRVNPPMGAQ